MLKIFFLMTRRQRLAVEGAACASRQPLVLNNHSLLGLFMGEVIELKDYLVRLDQGLTRAAFHREYFRPVFVYTAAIPCTEPDTGKAGDAAGQTMISAPKPLLQNPWE